MFPKVIIGAACLFITVLFHGAACIDDQDNTIQCKGFNQNLDPSSEYDLHQAIKKGLANNSTNLYNIQKTNLKQKSDSKIACLSVMFELFNITINDSSECKISVNQTFLWTSFDTSDYFGSLLLRYTRYDLRVFGFGWEDDCELYQPPINISISVDEIQCFTKDELCSALQYITTMLPAYSIAQNISIQSEEIGIGYAQPWKYMKTGPQEWKIDPTVSVIVISILVLSKMIIFTLVTTYYESVKQLMKGKSSPFYYFFWGCHCITLLALLIGNFSYIAMKQENKLIIVVSTVSAVIDIIGAVVLLIIKCRSELLPVPLTSYFELCGRISCIKAWEHILNLAAFFFTFFFISTILQTVPNILISYYAFPSRTLIRIGFFQVSFVCLVVAFGGLIFLLEKLGWLLHIKIHRKIPNELHSAALIIQHINIQKSQASGSSRAERSSNGQGSEPPHGNIQESSSGVLQQHSQASHSCNPTNSSNSTGGASLVTASQTGQQTEPQEGFENVKYSNKADLKYLKDLFIVGLQIVTALLLAVALFFLIIVIGIIVFTDSVDKDNVQGILTLLPTIVVDAVIIVTRKRFFDNKEALKYQLARVVDDSLETPNERTYLVQ